MLTPAQGEPAAFRGAKTALTNVRVFDGRRLLDPSTVVINGSTIGTDPADAQIVDAEGGVLLPGLIDAHVHLHGPETLEQLADYGVTTGLDMATWPPTLVDSLRARPGVTDIRSAGIPATASGSSHSRIPGFPVQGLVDSADKADQFVADRIAEGVDYIKIVADIPGPDQYTVNALVIAAHKRGKITVAHAASTAAFDMAIDAGVDIITHAPLDRPLDAAAVSRILERRIVVIPTLTMMEGIVERAEWGPDYQASRDSVSALCRAGVPILAGTDANAAPGVPAAVRHGESMHHELELLVDAGMSTVDALRSATALPAKYFGLDDRGVIEPGRRADLILIDGDPVADITSTRRIRRIWCGGIARPPA